MSGTKADSLDHPAYSGAYAGSIPSNQDLSRLRPQNTVFFPAVEREPHDPATGRPFPKVSRELARSLQVARVMSNRCL